MNRQFLLLTAVSFLILYWFIKFRHNIWIFHGRPQASIAKRKRKNKSRPFPFPTKRPECPLCQAEETPPSEVMPPEPPPLPMPIPTKGNGSPKLWKQITPAMAAGITDRVLTMGDLLMFRAPPYHQPLPKRIAA